MQDARSNILQDSVQQTTGPHKVTSSPQGLISTFKGIVRNEGFLSLWSGLKINLIRVIPATATTFMCYEYISSYLDVLEKNR
jgi:hypothetical protein